MTATLKHQLPDGTVARRRTAHGYGYVRVTRYRRWSPRMIEPGPVYWEVVGWHGTRAAAERACRSDQWVEAVNGGERPDP